MVIREHLWAIILPADGRVGDGFTPDTFDAAARSQRLTTAFARARSAVYRNRICVVSHAAETRARRATLDRMNHEFPHELPKENHFIQPSDCGTAISILLPLLHILFRDPDARVLILPCSDAADDEYTLTNEIQQVMLKLKSTPGIVLLGVRPDVVAPGFDYITMGTHDRNRLFALEQLIHSPSLLDAQALVDTGALWNTSIIAANANVLLDLFMLRMPDIVTDMQIAVIRDELTPDGPLGIRHLYWRLPRLDLFSDIVPGIEHLLQVAPVPSCGWSTHQARLDAEQDATCEQFSLRVNSR